MLCDVGCTNSIMRGENSYRRASDGRFKTNRLARTAGQGRQEISIEHPRLLVARGLWARGETGFLLHVLEMKIFLNIIWPAVVRVMACEAVRESVVD